MFELPPSDFSTDQVLAQATTDIRRDEVLRNHRERYATRHAERLAIPLGFLIAGVAQRQDGALIIPDGRHVITALLHVLGPGFFVAWLFAGLVVFYAFRGFFSGRIKKKQIAAGYPVMDVLASIKRKPTT